MKSYLLIDESPLVVLPSLAVLVGLNEAIAIQQIHWVCQVKAEHKDFRTFHDGFMWCSYKLDQWVEKMPWLSDRTCRRVLSGLEKQGVLIATKPNAKEWNHTKWYRIDYDLLDKLGKSNNQNCQIDVDKMDTSDRSSCPDQDMDKMDTSSISKKDLKKEILKRTDKNEDESPTDIDQPPVGEKNLSTPPEGIKATGQDQKIRRAADFKTTPLKLAKELVSGLCDWGRFFEQRKSYLEGTDYYRQRSGLKVVEGTVLRPYSERLEKAMTPWSTSEDLAQAIAVTTELIERHIGELGLNNPIPSTQGIQDTPKSIIDRLVVLAKTNPLEAQNKAINLATSQGLSETFYWNKVLIQL